VDYVGFYPEVVAWVQQYDPAVPCTVQFPVQVAINAENGPGKDPYGGPNTGSTFSR